MGDYGGCRDAAKGASYPKPYKLNILNVKVPRLKCVKVLDLLNTERTQVVNSTPDPTC